MCYLIGGVQTYCNRKIGPSWDNGIAKHFSLDAQLLIHYAFYPLSIMHPLYIIRYGFRTLYTLLNLLTQTNRQAD